MLILHIRYIIYAISKKHHFSRKKYFSTQNLSNAHSRIHDLEKINCVREFFVHGPKSNASSTQYYKYAVIHKYHFFGILIKNSQELNFQFEFQIVIPIILE